MATTKWQFFNTRTAQWVDFPKRIMVTLEKHSTTYGSSKTCLIEHGDADYKIDFQEMRAVDTRNFHRWLDIRRIELPAPSPVKQVVNVPSSPQPYVAAPPSPPAAFPVSQHEAPFSPKALVMEEASTHCKYYGNAISAGSLEGLLLLKEGNVAHVYIPVDLSKGDQLKPEFMALNPRHQVPVLEDVDGTVVWESNAILRYICNTFSIENELYPLDTKLRARCEMALDWRQTSFYPELIKVVYPSLGFGDDVKTAEAARTKLAVELQLLETFWLKNYPFICGASPSIADYAIVIPLLYLEAVQGFEVSAPVVEYIHRFASTCSHWSEVTQGLREYISSLRRQ